MRYFTSDLHFGHAAIITFCGRPYFNTQDMNESLIYNINAIVEPEDTLYILGDFSFQHKDTNVKYVKDIKCPTVLIRGNHDYSNRIKGVGFADVFNELDLYLGKHLVTLSHYPFRGDHTAVERFTDIRPKDVGQWLLHGHTHDRAKINKAERMIHVGVDAWGYAPVDENHIVSLIEDNEKTI